MTNIRASEYSPVAGQPLTPLSSGQVALLKRGATYDISRQVKTVVQRHFGYLGQDEFRADFTHQEITFTLPGSATENRTLKRVNSRWMLSQNHDTLPVKELDQAVTEEVDALVLDILSKISKARHTHVPDPATPEAAVVGQPEASAEPNAELALIRERLAALEDQIRSNPTLERSLQVQQDILRELQGLTAELGRRPHAHDGKRDVLMTEIERLGSSLAEEGKRNAERLAQKTEEFERATRVGRGRLEQLQAELAAAREELARQQLVHDAKDQAAKARVAELEAAVAKKESEQKQASAALDTFTTQAASANEQLQAELAAAREELARQQQAHSSKDQAANARVAELEAAVAKKESELRQLRNNMETFKAQVASIQQQTQAQCDTLIQSSQEELSKLDKAVKDDKAAAREKEAALRARKVELKSQLKSARSKLEAAAGEAKTAASELTLLQSAHEALLTNNEKRQAAYIDLSGKLSDAEALAERVPALEKYNGELQDGIRVALGVLERNKSLSKQNSEASQRFEVLQLENLALRDKLTAANTQNQVSTLTIQDLEASIAEKERQLEAAKKTAQIAQATAENERQRALEAQNKLSDTTDRLKEAELTIQYTEDLRSKAAKAHGQAQVKIKDLEAAYDKLSAQENDTYNLLVETAKDLEDQKQELQVLKVELAKIRAAKKEVETKEPAPQVAAGQIKQEEQLSPNPIPKQPPILSPTDSLPSSPRTAFSPTTEGQKVQIELLMRELAKINKNVRISERDKNGAIQNFIFLLFAEAKKQKGESIDLTTFDNTNLSPADRILLEQAAQTAVDAMASPGTPNYDLQKLFKTKERNLDGKMKALASHLAKGTIRTDSIEEITKLEGFAQRIFAHFFEKLKSMKPQKGEERNYEDFSFTTIAFLAGDLLYAEKIYEECKSSYEKLQVEYKAKNDKFSDELSKLDRILPAINEKIRQIKEVQRLFFALLRNSQVR